MEIKKFKELSETEYYKKLTMDSNVILYKNSFHPETDKYSWVWGIWGSRDVWDDLLKQNKKEYPELDINRMKVSDIIKQDTPEYNYVKEWCWDELEKTKTDEKL